MQCRPVEQPWLFGAGQSIHQLVCLRGDGGALVHGPAKVPLLNAPCCHGTAVHRVPQVGVDAVHTHSMDGIYKHNTNIYHHCILMSNMVEWIQWKGQHVGLGMKLDRCHTVKKRENCCKIIML